MKKQLIFVFVLSHFLFASAQKNISDKTIRVSYIKAYKNYRDKSNKPPRLMKNLEYELLCNPNAARFEYVSGMGIDDDNTNQRFIGKGGGKGIYYKNLRQNLKLHQVSNPLNGKKYLIKEHQNKYKWKLQKESKKILGYTCYKAIAKVKENNPIIKKEGVSTIIVWYTPSIPLPFGPAGYDGLPGLVLEAYKSSFYFIAQKIEFLDKNLPIKKPVKGIKVSEKEFENILEKSFYSRFGKIK